jgi:hypothetical protein
VQKTLTVSVHDELDRRGVTEKRVVVRGALEVEKNVLHNSEMALTRVMHVKVHLLNNVDVRPGECEVPEGPDQATVGSGPLIGAPVSEDMLASVH